MTIREREVSHRWIVFSGGGKNEFGTKGSERVEIPESVIIEEGQDLTVSSRSLSSLL